MEEIGEPNLFLKCRLCGIFGHHKQEIFDENRCLTSNKSIALREKIFRCVGVQVDWDDETTKICENCYVQIGDILYFRELCAMTNRTIRKLMRLRNDDDWTSADAIDESNVASDIENRKDSFVEIVSRVRCASSNPMVQSIVDGIDSEIDESEVLCAAQGANSSTIHEAVLSSERKRTEVNLCHSVSENRQKMEQDCSVNRDRHHSGEMYDANCDLQCGDQITYLPSSVIEMDSEFEENADVNIQAIDTTLRDVAIETKKRLKRKSVKSAEQLLVKCQSKGKCAELFENCDAMECHVSTHHAERIKRKISCHLCGKTFASKSNQRRHMNVLHIDLQHLKCPFPKCSQTFKRKDQLKAHTLTFHAMNCVFKCTKCPMIFYKNFLLKNHWDSEHGKGIMYRCYLCNKILATERSLQSHMIALHIGRKRFQCDVRTCSKTFAEIRSLKRHTNAVHTKKIVFKCTNCPSQFYRQDSLKIHSANMH